jgi:hypothetical protein
MVAKKMVSKHKRPKQNSMNLDTFPESSSHMPRDSLLFFKVLGFELRAFTLSHSTSPIFVKGFFEIGSLKLFAWAGFEL